MVFHKLKLIIFYISGFSTIHCPVVVVRHRNPRYVRLLDHVIVMTHQRAINLCVLGGEIQIKGKIYLQ